MITRFPMPSLKPNHTVIDLSKTGSKTVWNFAADEDVLFIASDYTRTQDRLQTIGGNNIVVIGGKFEPKSQVSPVGTLNFTKVNGSVYVEGVHINHKLVGEKDAIGFYSAPGKNADFILQNSLIENVKGSYYGIHGDVFQPQGPVGDIKFFNVSATTTYQGLFLQPRDPIKSVTLENVEIKKIPGGDPKSWLYFFSMPKDKDYPVSLKNVYVSEQPGQKAEFNSVYPPKTLSGAVRDGDEIHFPNHPYSGSIKVGSAGFITANEVGLNYKTTDNVSSKTVNGTSGADKIWGGSGNDFLYGGNGDDIISGGAGNDVIKGGTGNDVITGGSGRDQLYGGAGNDRFVFSSVNDSKPGWEVRDSVLDFNFTTDRIDLRGIDANTKAGGDQAFTYIGKAAFNGTPGQLKYYDDGGSHFVQADVNGDKIADFELPIVGTTPMDKTDFFL